MKTHTNLKKHQVPTSTVGRGKSFESIQKNTIEPPWHDEYVNLFCNDGILSLMISMKTSIRVMTCTPCNVMAENYEIRLLLNKVEPERELYPGVTDLDFSDPMFREFLRFSKSHSRNKKSDSSPCEVYHFIKNKS